MANVLHSALTGAELHEPKGIASAVNHTVYVANGAGSGSYKYFPPQEHAFRHINDITVSPTGSVTSSYSANYFPFGGIIVGSKCVMRAKCDSTAAIGTWSWSYSLKKSSSTIVSSSNIINATGIPYGASGYWYFNVSLGYYDPGDAAWTGTEAISTLAAGDALQLNATVTRTGGGGLASFLWHLDITWHTTIIPFADDAPWTNFRY